MPDPVELLQLLTIHGEAEAEVIVKMTNAFGEMMTMLGDMGFDTGPSDWLVDAQELVHRTRSTCTEARGYLAAIGRPLK